MKATAWNNGQHHESAAGYGIKISTKDRDRHFERTWGTTSLRIEEQPDELAINIDKESFWSGCAELIDKGIGSWLRKNKLAPWPKSGPPVLELLHLRENRFKLQRPS